jgi:hypothetical protein
VAVKAFPVLCIGRGVGRQNDNNSNGGARGDIGDVKGEEAEREVEVRKLSAFGLGFI